MGCMVSVGIFVGQKGVVSFVKIDLYILKYMSLFNGNE